MRESTKGIFLHFVPYADSAVIATVYTRKFGPQTFLVNGLRSAKRGSRINLFQPLYLLEMEVYHKPGRNLQRMGEVRLDVPLLRIPFDIKRSSQAIFIAEVLKKCLREEESNPDLFDFLFHAVSVLDLKEEGIANFVIVFLFRLTRYLGVFPREPEPGNSRFFDLVSASFRQTEPDHHSFMNVEISAKFAELFRFGFAEMEMLSIQSTHRTVLMSKLLEYYKIHLDMTGDIKSLAILREVFE